MSKMTGGPSVSVSTHQHLVRRQIGLVGEEPASVPSGLSSSAGVFLCALNQLLLLTSNEGASVAS